MTTKNDIKPWRYKGKDFEDEQIGEAEGFVYIITDLTNNRLYVGRKQFFMYTKRKVKGRNRRIKKESNWKTYFGSNSNLQQQVETHGMDNFIREIIQLCYSKSECAYMETKEIFAREAVIDDVYYNDWVSCKIRSAHLRNSTLKEDFDAK